MAFRVSYATLRQRAVLGQTDEERQLQQRYKENLQQWVKSQETDLAVHLPQDIRVVCLLQEAAKSELRRSRQRQAAAVDETAIKHEISRRGAILDTYKAIIGDVRNKLAVEVIGGHDAREKHLVKLRELASEGIGCLSTLLPWTHTLTAHDVAGCDVSTRDEIVQTNALFMTRQKLNSVNNRRAALVKQVQRGEVGSDAALEKQQPQYVASPRAGTIPSVAVRPMEARPNRQPSAANRRTSATSAPVMRPQAFCMPPAYAFSAAPSPFVACHAGSQQRTQLAPRPIPPTVLTPIAAAAPWYQRVLFSFTGQ